MKSCILILLAAATAAAQAPMTAEDALSVPQASTFLISPGATDISVASSEIDVPEKLAEESP